MLWSLNKYRAPESTSYFENAMAGMKQISEIQRTY